MSEVGDQRSRIKDALRIHAWLACESSRYSTGPDENARESLPGILTSTSSLGNSAAMERPWRPTAPCFSCSRIQFPTKCRLHFTATKSPQESCVCSIVDLWLSRLRPLNFRHSSAFRARNLPIAAFDNVKELGNGEERANDSIVQ